MPVEYRNIYQDILGSGLKYFHDDVGSVCYIGTDGYAYLSHHYKDVLDLHLINRKEPK